MSNSVKLNTIKNFIVYYGLKNLKKLADYDLIILESNAYNKYDIDCLKNNNSIVLAYLSVIEANTWDNLNTLNCSDFMLLKNEKIINTNYNTYIMNIFSKKWQNILNKKITYLIDTMNFDGLFLDTLGILENTNITGEKKFNYLIEASNFLKTIKYKYKSKFLIQNNGYLELYNYTKPYIDSVCFENIFLFNKNYKSESRFLIKLINDMKKNSIMPLFLLDKKTCPNFNSVYKNLKKLNSQTPIYISENEYL